MTAEYEVEIAITAAETKTVEAAILANTFILSANATAEATKANADADAGIMQKFAETRANAYNDLQVPLAVGGGEPSIYITLK